MWQVGSNKKEGIPAERMSISFIKINCVIKTLCPFTGGNQVINRSARVIGHILISMCLPADVRIFHCCMNTDQHWQGSIQEEEHFVTDLTIKSWLFLQHSYSKVQCSVTTKDKQQQTARFRTWMICRTTFSLHVSFRNVHLSLGLVLHLQ